MDTKVVDAKKPRTYLEAAFCDNALKRIIKKAGPIYKQKIREGIRIKYKDAGAPVETAVCVKMRESAHLFLMEIIEKALQFSSYRQNKLGSEKPKLTTTSILEALKLSRYNIDMICGTETNIGPHLIKMSGGGANKKPTRSDGNSNIKMAELDADIHKLKKYTLSLLPAGPIVRVIKIIAARVLDKPFPYKIQATLVNKKPETPIMMSKKALQAMLILVEQFITSLSRDAWAICQHKKHKTLQEKDIKLALEIKKYFK